MFRLDIVLKKNEILQNYAHMEVTPSYAAHKWKASVTFNNSSQIKLVLKIECVNKLAFI